MKIALMSDVHLEFGELPVEPVEADVLILAGDICVANDLRERDAYGVFQSPGDRSSRYHEFFSQACALFKHVIYIAGNHEHYHGDYAKSIPRLRTHLGYLKNLHILDKEIFAIDDVLFVGGTLWTNMNKEDPITLGQIKGVMNDYRIIEDSNEMVHYKKAIYKKDEDGNYIMEKVGEINSTIIDHYEYDTRPSKFSPEKTIVDHKAMLEVLDMALKQTGPDTKVVVVGHHAPCKQSTKPGYEGEFIINGAYSSDLTDIMLDNPKIKLWVHGHTHTVFDYMIGSTRVASNPRGYVGYERGYHKEEPYFAKVFEV